MISRSSKDERRVLSRHRTVVSCIVQSSERGIVRAPHSRIIRIQIA
jgi:hypothetical protein